MLEKKIDQLLMQKAQAEAVSKALPADRQAEILQKQMALMSSAGR